MDKYLRITLIVFFSLCIAACLQESALPEEATSPQQTQSMQEEDVQATDNSALHVLFFGDSITAGYGLELEQAFPALIQAKLDERDLPVRVTNGGLSGETSTGGLNRIDWLLRQSVDIFVLELGGNDGLRGIPLDLTAKNLQEIIDRVQEKNPDVSLIIAGMQIPPNLGKEYTDQFMNLFPTLAAQNNATLIPFLLEGVAGNEELNFPDGIHPTAEGHEIVAETVWATLFPMIDSELESIADCLTAEETTPEEEGCEIQKDILNEP